MRATSSPGGSGGTTQNDEVDFLSEADCPICKDGSGDKTQRCFELTEVPIAKPICVPCFYTFWTGIWGIPLDDAKIEKFERPRKQRH